MKSPGLDLSQRLKLEQKLAPQLIQSLQLLQLTTLELEQLLKQELEVNPFLEETTDLVEVKQKETAEEEPREEKDEQNIAVGSCVLDGAGGKLARKKPGVGPAGHEQADRPAGGGRRGGSQAARAELRGVHCRLEAQDRKE